MILVGHALDKLREIPDESVQVCCTSPPFYGLRNYGTEGQIWGGDPSCAHEWGVTHPAGFRASDTNPGPMQHEGNKNREKLTSNLCGLCEAYRGELGLEPTPEMFIQHVVEVFREVRRVLRKDGLLWIEIGDSYAAQGGGKEPGKYHHNTGQGQNRQDAGQAQRTPPEGLKPKDLIGIPWMLAFALRADGWYLRQDIIWLRPNPMPESVKDRCTKAHTYVFMLSKSPRYLYDADAVKEPHKGKPSGNKARKVADGTRSRLETHLGSSVPWEPNGEGRNRRSVWEVATQPYRGAHFATWPEKLVEPMILAGSRPNDIVLDPFCGSGTTWAVAARLGRRFIGIELNPQYVSLAHQRVIESCRKVLRVS